MPSVFKTILIAAAGVGTCLATQATAQQTPTFFLQASLEPFHVTESGGTTPARGAAISFRPVVGMIAPTFADTRLTLLGGAAVSRYETSASDTDTAFGMATLSKTINDTRFVASVLGARSHDPTFTTGVANVLDGSFAVSHPFTGGMLDVWTFTPQLKATRRVADLDTAERWDVTASFELARPAFGGTVVFTSGYGRHDYLDGSGRHDDRWSVGANWMIELAQNFQVGLRSEAAFTQSNIPGKSVDSFEVGPILRLQFIR